MELEAPLQCGGGCANCPRMKQCGAAAAEKTAAVFAPAEPSSGNAALDDFLRANPKQGVLRVQAFRGNQAIPVAGVDVQVSRKLGDGTEYVFYTGTTDESGLMDAITLPAPDLSQSVQPDELYPDASYQLTAVHPEFVPVTVSVDIFPGIKTVQPVQLQLREE